MATSNNIITFRRHDLDNLRTYLTGLVIVHHTMLAYGGVGSWEFTSASFRGKNPILMSWNGYNSSYFMGLFFWISGRMSAQSLARTSPGVFARSKILRLGVPAVVYSIVAAPLTEVILLPKWEASAIAACIRRGWETFNGIRGPVWYTATLLVFDLVTAAVTACGGLGRVLPHWLTYDRLSRWGWLGAALGSFVVRMWWPVTGNDRTPIIGGRPGHTSQYIYAYTLGLLAYHEGKARMQSPFESTAGKTAAGESSAYPRSRVWSVTKASAVSLTAMFLCFTPELLHLRSGQIKDTGIIREYLGGWNIKSLLYATWNEFSFVIVGPALMSLFQRRYSSPATSKLFSTRYSYAAFIVHAPVSVAVMAAVDSVLCPGRQARAWMDNTVWKLAGPVMMTAVVGMMDLFASFAIGRFLVDYVPGVSSFL